MKDDPELFMKFLVSQVRHGIIPVPNLECGLTQKMIDEAKRKVRELYGQG